MIYSKVHTTRKTGNYVRYFLKIVLLAVIVASCQKLDTATDDERDNITGAWSCSENSQQFGPQSFNVEVSKSPTDSTRILIDNFYGLGAGYSVYSKMVNLNLTIPSQTVNGNQITGSGTISSNYKTINWTYTVIGGGTTDHVTAVYTKK